MRNNLKYFLKDLRLENEHIILRHFIFEDNRAIYSLLSDKDSCYFDGGYEPYERYDEKYLTDFKSFLDDDFRFCIVDSKTNSPVGLLHLMEDNARACKAIELGFCIIPAERGKGYATSCVNLISTYLLETCKVDTVLIGTMEYNNRCQRVIEKCGFVFEGRRHKSSWNAWNKSFCDDLYYYKDAESDI